MVPVFLMVTNRDLCHMTTRGVLSGDSPYVGRKAASHQATKRQVALARHLTFPGPASTSGIDGSAWLSGPHPGLCIRIPGEGG